MNPYDLIRFVHIAAAVALLSASVIGSPAVRAAVRHARTAQEVRAYLSIGRPLLGLEPGAALAVLASGVYLASVAGFWTVSWVQVAVVFWVVNSVVALAAVKPVMSRLGGVVATAKDGPVGHDLDRLRWSASWSFGGDLLMADDAAMLYLMTMKPGLAGSLAAVAAANLVVVAVRAARGGFRTEGATAIGSGS